MNRNAGTASLPRSLVFAALLLALATPPASSAPLGEMLVDLEPGYFTLGADPSYLGTVGEKAIFEAGREAHARLWITDGTPEGTRPLDIGSTNELYPPQLSVLGTAGSHLFVLARSSGLNGGAVLAIDEQGVVTHALEADDTWDFYYLASPDTVRVVGRKLALSLSSSFLQQSTLVFLDGDTLALEPALTVTSGAIELLGSIGNELVFSHDDYETSSSALWRSSGSAATTSAFAALPGFPDGDSAVSAEGRVFFAVQGPGNSGAEAWTTDLTAPGTLAVTALPDPGARIGPFHADGRRAYFVVEDASFGQELFVSDGREAGTKAVTDFGFHQPFGGLDATILVSEHRAFFLATDGVGPYRLWLAGDRPESTRSLVENVHYDSSSRWIAAAGGSVFVAATDELGLSHLMASDGTEAGTYAVATGCSYPPCGLYPQPLASTASTFYFIGESEASIQPTLYATRPPFHLATPLFRALTEGPILEFSTERSVAVVGEKVYFVAGQYVGGYSVGEEPWVTTGTPATTTMIRRLQALESSLRPSRFRTTGGALAFSTDHGHPSLAWRRASLGAEAEQVPGEYEICFYESDIFALAGRFLFRDCDDEFWSFAPSGGPATRLTDFGYGSELRQAANTQIVGALRGNEAWRVGDPALGATLAQTLPPEASLGILVVAGENFVLLRDLDYQEQLVALGSDLTRFEPISPAFDEVDNYIGSAALGRGFFAAYPNGEASRVWTTDGTASGTRALFPEEGWALPVAAVRSAGEWFVVASVYSDGLSEQQVWRTDGTVAGSSLLASMPLESDVEGGRVAAISGRVLFTRRLQAPAAELWSVPAAGGTATALLPQGVTLRDASAALSVVSDRLFFAACDVAHGCELWVSEGTPETTRLFHDILPGAASSHPDQFLTVGNELVFTADDGLHGVEPWHAVIDGATCQEGHGALCLDDGRFRVRAHWKAPVAAVGDAGELPLTPDTGAFWFFDPDNVELIVKAIDGGGTNGHEWIFYGALSNVEYSLDVTDSLTGEAMRYFNPAGRFASTGDILAFPSSAAAEFATVTDSGVRDAAAPPSDRRRVPFGASGSCGATQDRFCILDGRFAVEATWRDFQGRSGTARAGSLTDDTGYFWFFDEANVEIVVKAIDGSAYNGQFWIYFGALSNVEYTIRVTDTLSDSVREYRNSLGRFASFGDIAAFPAD